MIQAEGTIGDRRLGLSFRDLSVYGYGSEAGESILLYTFPPLTSNRLSKDRSQRIVEHGAECSRSDV